MTSEAVSTFFSANAPDPRVHGPRMAGNDCGPHLVPFHASTSPTWSGVVASKSAASAIGPAGPGSPCGPGSPLGMDRLST